MEGDVEEGVGEGDVEGSVEGDTEGGVEGSVDIAYVYMICACSSSVDTFYNVGDADARKYTTSCLLI